MAKRQTMNLLLAGGVALPVGGLVAPFALFFVPSKYVYRLRPRKRGPRGTQFFCLLLVFLRGVSLCNDVFKKLQQDRAGERLFSKEGVASW
jgi:amino acid permease